MTSTRKLLAVALLASAAIGAAATAQTTTGAQAAAPGAASATASAPAPRGHGLGHLYAQLGLTAEQKDSVKALMTAARPQRKSLHEQMTTNRSRLLETPPDDPNYANVVAEVAQSNATLAAQRTTQGAQLQAQIYALLTPVQKTQLASLEAHWAANPQRRWDGHGGHGHSHGRGDDGTAPAGV